MLWKRRNNLLGREWLVKEKDKWFASNRHFLCLLVYTQDNGLESRRDTKAIENKLFLYLGNEFENGFLLFTEFIQDASHPKFAFSTTQLKAVFYSSRLIPKYETNYFDMKEKVRLCYDTPA